MLFIFLACFSKQQVTFTPPQAHNDWDAKSNLMGNISLAMNSCREKLNEKHMHEQGLCKTTVTERITKTTCSGIVSVRVVYRIDNKTDTIWCKKV